MLDIPTPATRHTLLLFSIQTFAFAIFSNLFQLDSIFSHMATNLVAMNRKNNNNDWRWKLRHSRLAIVVPLQKNQQNTTDWNAKNANLRDSVNVCAFFVWVFNLIEDGCETYAIILLFTILDSTQPKTRGISSFARYYCYMLTALLVNSQHIRELNFSPRPKAMSMQFRCLQEPTDQLSSGEKIASV